MAFADIDRHAGFGEITLARAGAEHHRRSEGYTEAEGPYPGVVLCSSRHGLAIPCVSPASVGNEADATLVGLRRGATIGSVDLVQAPEENRLRVMGLDEAVIGRWT